MYSFVVDNSEHEKSKGVNINVVAKISHIEYKDVLLNNKYLRHSMNRTQSKDKRIRLKQKIDKISFSRFDDKIYIQNNDPSGLALGDIYQKNTNLNNYLKKVFCQAYCFNSFSSQNSFICQAYYFNFESIKTLSDFWLGILNFKK